MNALCRNVVCLTLLVAFVTLGLVPTHADEPPRTPQELARQAHRELVLPGVTLAEGITEITGVAVSPLLGVSALGAWKYWRTEAALRDRLPWYCQPLFWGVGLLVVGLCLLKDLFGIADVALLKKPFDFLELFEDKASALMASAGFVPLVALAIAQYQQIQPADHTLAGFAASGLASVPFTTLLEDALRSPWITIPLGLGAFTVVWLSSHAINVLIVMSPFGVVDAGLKAIKLALVGLLVASSAIHPYLGACVSLVLILIGAVLAGWSSRLMVFGMVMVRDLLLNLRATGQDVRAVPVWCFLARRTSGVPARTLGWIAEGEAPGAPARFYFRPWLVLPPRSVALPDPATLLVCRGLLFPTAACCDPALATAKPAPILVLLPRYRGVELSVAQRLGASRVVDAGIRRGFGAIGQWFRGIVGDSTCSAN